jgi:hypothetical protein
MALGTTYFAGNDFVSWVSTGTVAVNTSLGNYRSAWVSSAMEVTCTSVADPPPDRIQCAQFVDSTNTPTTSSAFWVHQLCVIPATGVGNTLNAALLRCLDSSGVARLVVRGTGTSGQLKVDKRDAVGTFTNLFTTAAGAFKSGGLAQNFIDVSVSYSVAGSVALFINGVPVGSFSGDVTTDGVTALAFADFSSPASGDAVNWSECIISDKLTINAGLWRLSPQAAGVTQNWVGTAGDIDKTAVDDTTFIADGSAGDLSGWTTPTTPPSGAWLVQSIVQEARAAIGLSGPQHFDWYVRTADGSDHAAGVSNAPTTSFGNFPSYVHPQNPHTSADWVIGDIAAGFNLGVKSLA